jgi:hypothetical protein
MGRWIITTLLVTILFITLSTSSLADTGCFLEPESEEYCNQISFEDAEFECSLYDECNLDITFQASKQCSLYEECEEILCQSSCEYQLAGLCSSGSVPEGEEEIWCQGEACCQYWIDDTEPSCQMEENKWACHIAASNSGAETLNWDQSISENDCEEICLAETYPYDADLPDNDLKYYTIENADETEDNEEAAGVVSSESDQTDTNENIVGQLANFLAPFFLIFIIILIFIFFYEHRHTIVKDYHQVKSKFNNQSSKDQKKKNKTVNEIDSNYQTKKDELENYVANPSHHHHKHNHYKQHAQLEMAESFAAYKPAKLLKHSGIQKLQQMVKRYNRKHSRRQRSKENLSKKLSKSE